MSEPIRRRPRWSRFSLRMMLLAVTVLCVWLAIQVNAARRQREAVSAILKLGGSVQFDYQMVPNPRALDDTLMASWKSPDQVSPPGPAWLRNAIGVEYFRNVLEVVIQERVVAKRDFGKLEGLTSLRILYLFGETVGREVATGFSGGVQIQESSGKKRLVEDDDLVILRQLPQLELLGIYPANIEGHGLAYLANPKRLKRLLLNQTRLSDAGMEPIGQLTSLEQLDISRTSVTDVGLKFLRNLRGLKVLFMSRTGITDAGLVSLEDLTNLTDLHIDSTAISDTGLVSLRSLNNLKLLDISGTSITGAGLVSLQSLTNLEMLSASDTSITDAGLVFLRNLTKLKFLIIRNTAITDAGLDSLQGLANLQNLDIKYTGITDAGLQHLRSFPKLKRVVIHGTQTTPKGVQALRSALPNLEIDQGN